MKLSARTVMEDVDGTGFYMSNGWMLGTGSNLEYRSTFSGTMTLLLDLRAEDLVQMSVICDYIIVYLH